MTEAVSVVLVVAFSAWNQCYIRLPGGAPRLHRAEGLLTRWGPSVLNSTSARDGERKKEGFAVSCFRSTSTTTPSVGGADLFLVSAYLYFLTCIIHCLFHSFGGFFLFIFFVCINTGFRFPVFGGGSFFFLTFCCII